METNKVDEVAVATAERKNDKILEKLKSLELMFTQILEVLKPEPESESEPEAEPETTVVMALVHGIRYPDELAICGALGTKAQPFAAKPGERVARDLIEINCPKCRKIIEAKTEKNGKS